MSRAEAASQGQGQNGPDVQETAKHPAHPRYPPDTAVTGRVGYYTFALSPILYPLVGDSPKIVSACCVKYRS